MTVLLLVRTVRWVAARGRGRMPTRVAVRVVERHHGRGFTAQWAVKSPHARYYYHEVLCSSELANGRLLGVDSPHRMGAQSGHSLIGSEGRFGSG